MPFKWTELLPNASKEQIGINWSCPSMSFYTKNTEEVEERDGVRGDSGRTVLLHCVHM